MKIWFFEVFRKDEKKFALPEGNADGYEASFVCTWQTEEEFNTYAEKSIVCLRWKRGVGDYGI